MHHRRNLPRMENMKLCDFIGVHRDELIRRCRVKVAARSTPPPTEAEIDYGVPLFLNQLVEELQQTGSKTPEIRTSAGEHGRELLQLGFTVDGVVHDYGDVCQAVTELALHLGAPISTADFHTLNRCLDDAIAGAVTTYAHEHSLSHVGASNQLRALTHTAIAAVEALKSGNVGIAGSTGTVLHRSLIAILALVDRPVAVDR
jgi:hypothetical protein